MIQQSFYDTQAAAEIYKIYFWFNQREYIIK